MGLSSLNALFQRFLEISDNQLTSAVFMSSTNYELYRILFDARMVTELFALTHIYGHLVRRY